ncbi:MAG: hypothetical protein IPO93_13970 [Actinobacteria bacterium]|jgi:C4-dicarboxylate transporter/malic acid transport protein|nr:hypothetical protein [Actinomycetota bacterium]
MVSGPDMRKHPAWFGAVMGTGATSLVLLEQGAIWGWSVLDTLAVVFLLLASLLAVLLWPRYVARLGDRAALHAEMSDPGHGAMLGTFPAGLLVLAVAWGKVGPQLVPATVALWADVALLVVGAVIAVALGIAWASSISMGTQDLASVNGGWLIPPVMNLLVPIALVPVIVRFPDQAPWLLVVGFAFLGIGTVLFLAMFGLLVTRLALRPPPAAPLAPSLWIPLAPAGILGVAFLRLLQAAERSGVDGFSSDTAGIVIASMGVGLGLWWALFATVELLRIRRSGEVPFHPGWWGYVFPIAAMTLSIAIIGEAVGSTAIEIVSAGAAVILLVVWGLVAVRTIGLVRSGRTR